MPTLFIDPGALRTELALEACTPIPDGLGGFDESWLEKATVFARVEPASAASRYGAGQTLETVTHHITMRYRADISSGMRLRKQARIFSVLTVHDPDESGRYLVCKVEEVGA